MSELLEIVIQAKDEFSSVMGKLGSTLSPLRAGLAGLAAAAATAAGGAGLVALAKAAADDMDALSKLQDRLGFTTETLSKLRYASDLADVSFEELKTSLQFMARNTAQAAAGNQAMRDSLADLGIELGAIKSLSPDRMFDAYAQAIAGIENPAERARLATEVFGRSGGVMLQMLKDGREGLAELSREAERYGAVVSQQAAYNSAEFNDSLTRVGASLKGVRNALAEQFLPVLTGLFKNLSEWIADNRQKVVDWSINFVQAIGGALESVIMFGARASDVFTRVNASLTRLQVKENADAIKYLSRQAEEYAQAVSKIEGDLDGLRGSSETAWGQVQIKAAQQSLEYYRGELERTTAEILRLNNENQQLADQFSGQSDWFSEERAQAFFQKIKSGLEDLRQAGTAAIPSGSANVDLKIGATDEQRSQQKQVIEELKKEWGEYYLTESQRIDAWYNDRYLKLLGHKEAEMKLEEIYQAKKEELQLREQERLRAYLEGLEQEYENIQIRDFERRTTKLMQLEVWYQQQLEMYGAYEEARAAIENLYNAKKKQAADDDEKAKIEQRDKELAATEMFLGGMAALSAQFGRKTFMLTKGLRIGEAIMNTYAGAAKVLSDPSFTYPYNLLVAASVIAFGMAQVAQISKQKPPEAHTGLDFVPREQTYMLSRGERVVQPGANKDLTEFLDQARTGVAGGAVSIGKIEVFPNVTDARAIRNIDDREMEEILEEKIYPAMRRLSRAGIQAS